jgi:hypothetical protein
LAAAATAERWRWRRHGNGTHPSNSCRNLYYPLSTTIICCLFVSYFGHHCCQVSPLFFDDLRMGSIALPPPLFFLLFAHLPCLPLDFLPHQIGTPLSVYCCFFNCVLSSSSSWCLPPGGILDGMGALSLSFPLAVFPPYPSVLRLPPHLLARPSLRGRVPHLIRVHHHLAEGDVVSP